MEPFITDNELTEAMRDKPDWDTGGRVHNWKTYIHEEVRELWPTFTPEQRAALARNAQEIADGEEWD